MHRTSLNILVLTVVATSVVIVPVPTVSAEDYIPARSGKQYTPRKGPPLRVLAGFDVGVPIFLDVDTSVVRPGGSLTGWVGLDIGWLAFSAGFGSSWNAIDLTEVEDSGLGRSPLARIWIYPEIRFQIPKAKAVLPYLSGAFDLNWWRHREVTELSCSFWYCLNRSSFSFAPGFTGRLGMGIRAIDRIYIDIGVKYSFTGTGDFFPETEMWVTPYLGIIYRGDPG